IAVFASASESYSRKNLNRSRDEAIAGYGPVIKKAKDAGLRVRGYLSMVIADPWDGPTPAAVVADLSRQLLDFGCDEISLGDTIGVGTPGEVSALLAALRRGDVRSEEHTSELQSRFDLVCRLLLEKKKIPARASTS